MLSPVFISISGNVSVGNLPNYLPFVLAEIEKQPKRQYLLLHSLKEVSLWKSPQKNLFQSYFISHSSRITVLFSTNKNIIFTHKQI